MSIQIPSELLPLIREAVERGHYASEQELVADVLRLAAPALQNYHDLKERVARSIEDEKNGRVKEANFQRARQRLSDESAEYGQ